MTSREIAELVDQRHDNVKRTIETLSAAGTITPPQFEEVPNTGPGPRTINIHRLDKRSSLIVVAQLNQLTMAAPISARLTVQEMTTRAPDVFCCSQRFSAVQAAQAARMVSA